jgi:hypothetical protein
MVQSHIRGHREETRKIEGIGDFSSIALYKTETMLEIDENAKTYSFHFTNFWKNWLFFTTIQKINSCTKLENVKNGLREFWNHALQLGYCWIPFVAK